MKIRIELLLLALASFSVAYAQEKRSLPPPPEEQAVVVDIPFAIADAMLLDDEERLRLEEKALGGDGQSAMRVAAHFSTDSAGDAGKARYWYTVAAENGDATGQYNLWSIDRNSTDPWVKARALFWLKKSAGSGDELAQEKLHELGLDHDNAPTKH